MPIISSVDMFWSVYGPDCSDFTRINSHLYYGFMSEFKGSKADREILFEAILDFAEITFLSVTLLYGSSQRPVDIVNHCLC